MWQACSYNFQINFPQISERIRWPLCYCYMDHLRKTYSSLRVKTLSDNESMTIVLGVAKICVIPKDLRISRKNYLTNQKSHLMELLNKSGLELLEYL